MEKKARYLGDQVQKQSRELSETPEEGNTEPSLGGDPQEGATTSEDVLSENMNHHERGTPEKVYFECRLVPITLNIDAEIDLDKVMI